MFKVFHKPGIIFFLFNKAPHKMLGYFCVLNR